MNPTKQSKPPILAYFAAITAIILWGISFITIKIALVEVSPVTLIILRFSLGALIVGAAATLRKEWGFLSWRDLPGLAVVGLVGITLQQFLQIAGQARAEAVVAGFLASTAPAFIVILASIFLHEPQSLKQSIGVALALLGAFLVVTNGRLVSFDLKDIISQGSLLILASSIVWAGFVILSKKAVHNKPATTVTSAMFFFGVVFSLPFFIFHQGWQELGAVSPLGWGAILFTAILCTGAAYLLNTSALKTIPASRVAVIQTLEPVVVMVAAATVLGETITLPMAFGGALILGGVLLAQQTG